MPARTRTLLAISAAFVLAIVVLIAEQTIRSHTGSEGIVQGRGQLLGGDYAAFYLGGRLFREDRPHLYDLDHQAGFRDEWLGQEAGAFVGELPFVYPPLVAALVSPFSSLPFRLSYWTWLAFGLVVSLTSLAVLIRASGAKRVLPTPFLLFLCLGFVPFSLNATVGGQIPWLGIMVLALVASAVLKEKDFLAGLAMSLSYYKPPIFLFLLLALFFSRERRFFFGFLTGAVLLMGSTLLLVGPEGFLQYLDTASHYTYGQELVYGTGLPESYGMGLVGLAFTLTSSLKVTLLILALPFFALVWIAATLLRRHRQEDRLLGLMLGATATGAFSLQFGNYDLALLLVPMVLGLAWYETDQAPVKLAVLIPFLGFFVEFAFRNLRIGGSVFHASAALLIITLGLMVWMARSHHSRPERESGPRILPQGP